MTPLSINDLNVVRKEAYGRLERKEYGRALALFEHVFDGKEAWVASCMGFIYSRRDSGEYNRTKAKRFYRIAAEQGDTYAQYALGGLLTEDGNSEDAQRWYTMGSDAGEPSCSYILYRHFKSRGDNETAERYFNRAVDQGNPIAFQHLSIRYVKGYFGISGVLKGFNMYIKNIPKLIRYIKENVS